MKWLWLLALALRVRDETQHGKLVFTLSNVRFGSLLSRYVVSLFQTGPWDMKFVKHASNAQMLCSKFWAGKCYKRMLCALRSSAAHSPQLPSSPFLRERGARITAKSDRCHAPPVMV